MDHSDNETGVQAKSVDLRRLAARQVPPLGIALVLVWLMWDRVQALDFTSIGAGVRTVGPLQWGLALALTAVSFWAVGRYDGVVHRLIGTSTPTPMARKAGVASIAVAQTVGFGVISGALVRWRMLPEVSLLQAIRISATVAVTFLAGWAVVAALAVLLVPLPVPGATPLALVVLVAAALFVALSVIRPAALDRLNLPTLPAMAAIVTLAFIDTIAAGAALWVLLPEGLSIAPVTLIAAFLLALGAGLVSGTPGGVGPFEVTLLALLPHTDHEPVLAAILAFRAAYYALPALLGAAVVIRGPIRNNVQDPALQTVQQMVSAPGLTPQLDQVLLNAPRAEAALLRHGRLSLLTDPRGRPDAMVAASGQSLILLADPLRREVDGTKLLAHLGNSANLQFRSPILYKCGARLAATARRAGWATLPVVREAWLNPASFSLEGSSRRQLRRKLRKAEGAGVIVAEATGHLPLSDMADIARDWNRSRGGERGFSMGTWDPATLPWSRVFLARRNGQLVGFLTLHSNASEQTLDLMRGRADAPDGTMHLLLTVAIKAAARKGCPRLSLAAVPLGKQGHEPALFHHLRDGLDRISGAGGLRQFKSCFASNWEVLYLAAPNRAGLVLGAWDICREIARPDRSQGTRRGS
ncbi:phosphatidylglycerol lysyltransferase domain-containing protein [Aliiroseovarius subalbicans]|uniref:phosphatidylglycerol lysyltransferase domain-containing protein n=1 Tax=Aliiroseovarius subalbicans TaxID=2925840 RepID=UPI001F589F35|nr:phosphatidylglycerol lysyltransferase domain-containing protein [Aliiroseovarius subalbicans]MCI2398206.1 phosphatidylglycerol lysyltransferase domain-containing protein [Aliiroseovarius subalbicans]